MSSVHFSKSEVQFITQCLKAVRNAAAKKKLKNLETATNNCIKKLCAWIDTPITEEKTPDYIS